MTSKTQIFILSLLVTFTLQATGLWKGEGNGADTTGTFADGTLSNASYTTGMTGDCFSFSGSDDSYFDTGVTSSFDFQGSSDFTIAFWTKPQVPTLPVTASFVSKASLGAGWAVLFLVHDANHWDISFTTPGVSGPTSGSNLPMNNWTHVIVTRLSGVLTFYFNGVASFFTSGYTLSASASTSSLVFGETFHYPCTGYCEAMIGLLDEVRVSDVGTDATQAAVMAGLSITTAAPTLAPTTNTLSTYPLLCGSDPFSDSNGSIGVSPTCSAVPAISPLTIADATTFRTGYTDNSGNIVLSANVCEMNPQAYQCTNFSSSDCSCLAWTAGYNGTGRSPFDTVLQLVDENGTVISQTNCPYTTSIDSSCSGGCAISYLTIPFTTPLSQCGFKSKTTNFGSQLVFTGWLRANVTEYYRSVSGQIVTRGNLKTGVYQISFPTRLTVSNGVTVTDRRIQAQIPGTKLNVYNGLGRPSALVTLQTLIQNPLMLADTATVVTSNPAYSAAVQSVNRTECQDPNAACILYYDVLILGPIGCTFASETYNVTFNFTCTAQSIAAGTCPMQGGEQTSVAFSFEALNFCPQPLVIQVSTNPSGLITYQDVTLTTTQTAFFTGATVYAAATNFNSTALDGTPAPPVSAVSLPSYATWSLGAASITVNLVPVGSCTPAKCGFSSVIPSTTLPQPGENSAINVTLSVIYTVSFTSGAKRRIRQIISQTTGPSAVIVGAQVTITSPTAGAPTSGSIPVSSSSAPLILGNLAIALVFLRSLF